jgi:hypothetical protein
LAGSPGVEFHGCLRNSIQSSTDFSTEKFVVGTTYTKIWTNTGAGLGVITFPKFSTRGMGLGSSC